MIEAERTLWTDSIDNRGVLAQPSLPNDGSLENGLHRVVSLGEVARKTGRLIAPLHFEGVWLEESPELNVTKEDLALVFPEAVEKGLYSEVSRFNGVNQNVRVYGGESELDIKGKVPCNVAVAFHEDDHKKLAHSAVYLASHSRTTTLSHNPVVQNSVDRTERDRKSGSSIAKSMASKTKAINEFDEVLIAKRDLFVQAYRAFRTQPPVRYRPQNANALLMKVDAEIRRIVETSGQQRGLTPDQRAAAQRALTVNLYQRGNSQKIWRAYIEMGGKYFNAQRVKLDESRNACKKLYESQKHHIKPEEEAEFDALVYSTVAV